jgi:Na+-transporting methylmalonyl-CoA/oxaloacetate decarboxylase gamma subunit
MAMVVMVMTVMTVMMMMIGRTVVRTCERQTGEPSGTWNQRPFPCARRWPETCG